MAAIKAFKSAGVLVFADSKKDRGSLPSGVQSLRKKQGRFIPMLYALSADGSEGIDVVPYETLKEDARGAARKLKKDFKKIEESLKQKEDEASADSGFLAEEQEWTNIDGRKIRAAVANVGEEKVEFVIKKKRVMYPLNKLDQQSREKLESLSE